MAIVAENTIEAQTKVVGKMCLRNENTPSDSVISGYVLWVPK